MAIGIILILSIHIFMALAQRNEKEEKICQPFLTSKYTSPLLPHLKRNLRVDEEGEFACDLVLQDRFLPNQIRFTIHEGLYMLALRHIEIGIDERLDE